MKEFAWAQVYAILLISLLGVIDPSRIKDALGPSQITGDLIVAVATVVGPVLAVLLTILAASAQIKTWRAQEILKRRASTAEAALISIYKVDEFLTYLRSPRFEFLNPPKLGESFSKYEREVELLNDAFNDFSELRKQRMVLDVVIEDRRVLDAVDVLLSIQRDILWAIHINTIFLKMSMPPLEQVLSGLDEDIKRNNQIIFGKYDAEDVFGHRQIEAVQTVKKILGPFVRYEA